MNVDSVPGSGTSWWWCALRVLAVLAVGVTAIAAQETTRQTDHNAGHRTPDAGPKDSYGDSLPPGAVARLGTLRLRQPGDVSSVAFAPDGCWLVAVSSTWSDSHVVLWDTQSGQRMLSRRLLSQPAHEVAVAPSGRIAAIACSTRVLVWDISTNEDVALFEVPTEVTSVALSPDGRTVASATLAGIVSLWDVTTGRKRFAVKAHTRTESDEYSKVTDVEFSPDGATLASACWDGIASLWDVADGRLLRRIEGNGGEINDLAFSPDGKTIALGTRYRSVSIREVATGNEVLRIRNHPGIIEHVAFSTAGRTIASVVGGAEGAVFLWDVRSGERLAKYSYRGQRAVAFAPNGQLLAAAGQTSRIRLLAMPGQPEPPAATGHASSVEQLFFSSDSKHVVSLSCDGTVFAWDIGTAQPTWELGGPDFSCATMANSPVENILAVAEFGGSLALWTLPQGRVRLRFPEGKAAISAVAFDPSGRVLACGLYDGAVHLLDTATGRARAVFEGLQREAVFVAFSADGRTLLALGEGGAVLCWDVRSRKIARAWTISDAFRVHGASVSRDSKLLAVVADHVADAPPCNSYDCIVYDFDTGEVVLALDEVFSNRVAFSPNNKMIAVGDSDGTVRLMEVATGKPLAQRAGHARAVECLAFSPNGKLLASGGDDTTVLVWNVGCLCGASSERETGPQDRASSTGP
ncbi:MAG: WD40 repeat domain-containing protein [Pirellulales bacterium]|nr:WD40 repeat domain-containing protein [Pirellulales bacterium]